MRCNVYSVITCCEYLLIAVFYGMYVSYALCVITGMYLSNTILNPCDHNTYNVHNPITLLVYVCISKLFVYTNMLYVIEDITYNDTLYFME